MQLYGQAGNTGATQDGALSSLRLGRLNDLIVSELHGRLHETNVRGNLFSAYVSAYTIVSTTDISPLPANTGVPILGLMNPAGSGKNFSIVRAIVTTTSGTPGGPIWWNVIPSPCGITAATNFTALNNATFNAAGSVSKVYSATAITGSSAGVPLCPLGGPAASAVGAGLYAAYDEPAGGIIIPQGAFAGLAATATGSSHVVSAAIFWEEVPV